MSSIVVYSIVGCPHCKAAKQRLKEEKLQFVDVSVDRFPPSVREWVRARTGKTSVPQIFFHDRHIGGNAELQALLDTPQQREEALALLEGGPGEGELPLMPHPSEAIEDTDPGDDLEFVCEKDEVAEVARKLEESGLLATHRTGLFSSSPSSITGAALTSFLEEQGVGVEVGQALLDTHLVVEVGGTASSLLPSSLYTPARLLHPKGLNNAAMAECKVRDADTMARDLRKVVLKLFADFLSPDGRTVDYRGMGASANWDKFLLMATQLQRVSIEDMSEATKLAFFINIYNVLVIHGTVVKGVPGGLIQRYKFFSSTCYTIGGHLWSLNDIENGILRSNRSSMATLYRTPLGPSDPRTPLILPTVDPRIHFALNCGARSCPPIKTFSGEEVHQQLEVATGAYLEGEDALVVDTPRKQIKLSMLFKWYAVDFGNTREEVLAWVLEHLADPSKKKVMEEVMKEEGVKVSYIPYDWGNNGKE